jgi:hypothetical protein
VFVGDAIPSTSCDTETDWEDEQDTWSISAGTLSGLGVAASGDWSKYRYTTEIPLGFVATFTKTSNIGAFLFCSDDDYDGYLAWWNGTSVGFADILDDTVLITSQIPCAETGTSEVTVAVWPKRYSDIDVIDDVTVALWFDGKLLLSHTMEFNSEKGSKVGFGVYEDNSATFDNLRIAQLHQIVDWTSVDPGETVSSGLSRVMAHEAIAARARYDGSVKVWRNDSVTVDWTIPANRVKQSTEIQDIFWPRHLRIVGAVHEVDVFRTATHGTIFSIGQDPNALSEEETYDRAGRQHEMLEERARRKEIVIPPNPVIEPEDVVSEDSISWRVSSINYRAIWVDGQSGGAPVLVSSMEVRECL